ncbi:MAG: ABC transporter substrate-binding protein [Deltaproteobacteria bacterium]|nr:ABC transporter substrate-binding protein [Deltaproteobacteria bacterium]
MRERPTNSDTGLPGVLLHRRKTVSLIVLGLLFAAIMVSCGKSDGPRERMALSNKNVLRYDVTAPFTSLNPNAVKFSGSNHIFPLLYSYLFVPNAKGELEPDLAVSWAFDPDKLYWTIHLRSDAVFHNKRPVTSNDVKYSFEKQLKNIQPDLKSVIERISLLSDTAFRVHLKKEDSLMLQKIWDFEITPYLHDEEIDYFHHPIGSGPFKFKYRENNKMVVLEANDDFYNGRPPLDKIVFRYQPDREKAWTRLLAGKTDIVQEITPKNLKMMKNYQDRFYFDQYTLRFYTILLYNPYDSLFSDPKVRRALSLAIDRWYIVENILGGYGKVANGPMGVDSPYHNPEVKPVPFDPQKALALLKEAGWTLDGKSRSLRNRGKPFEFTLLVYKECQIEKKVARYIQLCLNDIGIRARLQALCFEEIQRRRNRNIDFEAVVTELNGAYRNPEFIQTIWSPVAQRKSCASFFKHLEVTRLIKKGLEEKDPEKQKAFFYEIDALITSLQPGTFLFQKTAIDAMSKRFYLPHQFSLSHEGIHRLRYATLRHE